MRPRQYGPLQDYGGRKKSAQAIENARIRQMERREERKQELRAQYEGKPCMDCGSVFPFECMDFDHVRGEKKFLLSKHMNHSKEAVNAELEKCDLVCSNCHRVRTHSRLDVRRSLPYGPRLGGNQ